MQAIASTHPQGHAPAYMDPLTALSWDWIRCFVLVAERGSIAAAAQQLGSNAATVSRQIAALERQLGCELFVRSRQGMQTTPAAQRFLPPARAMQAQAQQLGLGAAAQDAGLSGLVRISASVTLANFVLPELLVLLRALHPGIRIELIATDAHSKLLEREADIAIRLADPVQEALVARRITQFPIRLYASHAYLARHGLPQLDAPAALMQHHFIDVAPQHPMRDGFTRLGLPQLGERVAAVCSDHATAWQLVRAGLGIGSSLAVVAARDAGVAPVLGGVDAGRFPVWLVMHKGLRTQPRLRVVADHLAQALKSLGG